MSSSTSNVLARFARTTEEIFSLQELQRVLDSGQQLRIKYGVDLTAPHLHIGPHTYIGETRGKIALLHELLL